MKVFVTGADGFIGSNFVDLLLKRGFKVKALSQYNSFNNFGWLTGYNHKNLEILSGDVRDLEFCTKVCNGVDVIFNFAALISIPYSYQAPYSYIDTNIKGTLNLCLAARRNKIKRFIQLSTSEVYGSAITMPITEKHPYQPQSQYSASKIGSDAIAKSFFYTGDLDITIARPFNTFGPRQSLRAIIPTIIMQVLSKKKTIHLGNIHSHRDFLFVQDTCRGILSLLKSKKTIGEDYNIGSGKEISIHQTYKLIKKICNSKCDIKIDKKRLRPKASEVNFLLSSNKKIYRDTKWKPKYNFESGLELTISWFRDNYDIYKKNVNRYFF